MSAESAFAVQTVDFGESGPIRCTQCKAYMSPHMHFVDRGRKFKCCFCGTSNATPVDYICNTGVDGRRHDANDRAELCRGSVDFVASKEYMVSTLTLPSHSIKCAVAHLACLPALECQWLPPETQSALAIIYQHHVCSSVRLSAKAWQDSSHYIDTAQHSTAQHSTAQHSTIGAE